MDINTPQRQTRTAGNGRPSWTMVASVICLVAVATSAAAQVRQSGGRVAPDETFETVWVVDRTMSEFAVWQTLVHLTSADALTPVVLHGGEDERWTTSLGDLLGALPMGERFWVSDRGTLFDVTDTIDPVEIAESDDTVGPLVYSAHESLDPIAALIAMRLDGVLTAEQPARSTPAVFVGVAAPVPQDPRSVYLPDRRSAVDHANRLADRPVAMIVNADDEVPPEAIVWVFQRDAKILEVEVPAYSIYDSASEETATLAVRDQIRGSMARLIGADLPEAIVVVGDWHQIPFRFPRGNPQPCSDCDNGVFEYAADIEYANLDGDSWGEPDVPVGRLMSPHRDLLAIQSVVGIWREWGAFSGATEGIVVDLLGPRQGLRDRMTDRWRETHGQRFWTTMGPEPYDPRYRLDHEAFFNLAGWSDIVVIHGHGSPDGVSPNGSPFNESLSGRLLTSRESAGRPSFWFLHACSTGKPDAQDGNADQTLLVGLQGRIAYGSLMAVEVLGAGSGDPAWWIHALQPGVTVGELVRRHAAASIAVYRDAGEAPVGMPQSTGDPERDRINAYSVLTWIGDPLTPMEEPVG